MTYHRRCRRHEDGTQPCIRCFNNRCELVLSCFLKMIGKLHNKDSVFGNQADERDQTHLTVDVESRKSEEREQERAGNRQRYRARQNDKRIAKALELSCKHEVNQHCRQEKGSEKLA